MLTSLVLLVTLVSSMTAAPLQQVLDDRLINQSRDTLPLSPEVGVGSDKVDSKKFSRRYATKVNGDSKETEPSQNLFPIDNQDDHFPASSLPLFKKTYKKQITSGTTKFPPGTNEIDITSTERPISKTKSTFPDKQSTESKALKKGRKNKAPIDGFSYKPRGYEYSNFEADERIPGSKKRKQDSNIHFIRLPPTPYTYFPGLGFISQPPRYSTPLFPYGKPIRPARPPTVYKPHVNPLIKVPIDFVSNGKPTSVYQWQKEKPVRPENHITNLDKKPYVFNGRPTSLYLLMAGGLKSAPTPIRLPNYQKNGYY